MMEASQEADNLDLLNKFQQVSRSQSCCEQYFWVLQPTFPVRHPFISQGFQ